MISYGISTLNKKTTQEALRIIWGNVPSPTGFGRPRSQLDLNRLSDDERSMLLRFVKDMSAGVSATVQARLKKDTPISK